MVDKEEESIMEKKNEYTRSDDKKQKDSLTESLPVDFISHSLHPNNAFGHFVQRDRIVWQMASG